MRSPRPEGAKCVPPAKRSGFLLGLLYPLRLKLGGFQSLPRHMLRVTPGSFICLPVLGGGMLRLTVAYAAVNFGILHICPASPRGIPGLTAAYAAVYIGNRRRELEIR